MNKISSELKQLVVKYFTFTNFLKIFPYLLFCPGRLIILTVANMGPIYIYIYIGEIYINHINHEPAPVTFVIDQCDCIPDILGYIMIIVELGA